MKVNKGFSLAEVLMLFAVLSVIIAATVPMHIKHTKSVPTKLSHGLYMCYRDTDGNLKEALYSSYKRISEKSVDACTFTPPTNATMFKVTLIGAGSGGYALAEVKDDTDDFESKIQLYNLTYTGQVIRMLTEDELKEVFGGEKVIVYTKEPSGNGGNGCGVLQQFHRTYDVFCEGHPYDGLTDYRKDYYKREDAIQSGSMETIKGICWNTYGTQIVQYPIPALGEVKGIGGEGGRGRYAKYEYTISKTTPGSYKTYLSKIPTAATKGYCNKSNCSDFSVMNNNLMTSGTNCIIEDGKSNGDKTFPLVVIGPMVQKNGWNARTNVNYTPTDPTDASGYVAIQWKDPIYFSGKYRYYTSGTPATKGGNASVDYNYYLDEDGYQWSWGPTNGTKGNDATGGVADYHEDVFPVGLVQGTRIKRTYTLGKAGNSGEVKNYSINNLGTSPCKIYIGQGTKGHNEDQNHRTLSDAEFKAQVNTVLKCSALELKAEGGEEQYDTKIITYYPRGTTVDRTDKNSGIKQIADAPEKPDFTKPNFWFSLFNNFTSFFPSIPFGQGGTGSFITDKCKWQSGTQSYGTVDTPNKGSITFPENADGDNYKCRSTDFIGTDEQKLTVGAGQPGALIIRW